MPVTALLGSGQEQIEVGDLGLERGRHVPGSQVLLPRAMGVVHFWDDRSDRALRMAQVAARQDLYDKAGQVLARRSAWPTAIVSDSGRPIGHVEPVTPTAAMSAFDGNLDTRLYAWRWFCALVQAVHGCGWTFGGLLDTVTFGPGGLPAHWGDTNRTRPSTRFRDGREYREARAEERLDLAWLILGSLGVADRSGGTWTPAADLSLPTAGSLSLLATRVSSTPQHPPMAREWQIALGGRELIQAMAGGRRRRTSESRLEMVVLVLPTSASSEQWRRRWSAVLGQIGARGVSYRVSAHVQSSEATQVLAYSQPVVEQPPHWEPVPALPDAGGLINSLSREILVGSEMFVMDGFEVTAVRLLLPAESSNVDVEWTRELERFLECPVTAHHYAEDGRVQLIQRPVVPSLDSDPLPVQFPPRALRPPEPPPLVGMSPSTTGSPQLASVGWSPILPVSVSYSGRPSAPVSGNIQVAQGEKGSRRLGVLVGRILLVLAVLLLLVG